MARPILARTGRVEGLRVRHEDSITLKCEIPIVFANNPKGAKHIFINDHRLPCYLDLGPQDLTALRKAGLIAPDVFAGSKKTRLNYYLLAQEYVQKLENGDCATRSELAISPGASRAWISEVMRRGRQIDSSCAKASLKNQVKRVLHKEPLFRIFR